MPSLTHSTFISSTPRSTNSTFHHSIFPSSANTLTEKFVRSEIELALTCRLGPTQYLAIVLSIHHTCHPTSFT
ncbi:hypothetical protein BGX38DRAFT_1208511, partial [Terfezia claveryi]